MRVLLHGCNGRMGRAMTRVLAETADVQVVCGVDVAPDKAANTYPVYSSLAEVSGTPDIAIDFSHHSTIDGLLAFGTSRGVPLVICTTGFTADERRRMADAAAKIPILSSPNMSLGVNLLLSLVREAAEALRDEFDVEIVERHHNQKADSPSGTAELVAETVKSAIGDGVEYVYGRHSKTDKRRRNQIGIHAVRGGAIVGDHEVIFAGQGEVLEIRHSVLSRDVFAYGALRAARFLVGKGPGLYGMKDVIEEGNRA